DIIKDAQVSELTISTGTPATTVRLRKPIAMGSTRRLTKKIAKSAPKQVVESVSGFGASVAPPGDIQITAPMVGIFHSFDSMTSVGAPVKKGQVLGAIESMKLMNDIVSRYDGVISEILIEDGMPVEYGQSLLVLSTE
ncbi:MAG TPA: biotin/lipoyl-containing protein, partial [Armatimonadota bacterium]